MVEKGVDGTSPLNGMKKVGSCPVVLTIKTHWNVFSSEGRSSWLNDLGSPSALDIFIKRFWIHLGVGAYQVI